MGNNDRVKASNVTEWIKARSGRFTSSELHKLMTGKGDKLLVGHQTYVKEKVAEIATGRKYQWGSNDATEWGNERESEALDMLEIEHGYLIGFSRDEQMFFPMGDHFGGTPDGVIESERAAVEVKCQYNQLYHLDTLLNIKTQEDLKKHKKEYYWQCVSNAWITGMDRTFYVSYHPHFPNPHKVRLVEVALRQKEIDEIEKRLKMAVDYKTELLKKLNLVI